MPATRAAKNAPPAKPARKPAATAPRPAPATSRVSSMLKDIHSRGEQLTSDINALLVRLS